MQRVQFLTESACRMCKEAGAQGGISGAQGTNPHPDLISITTIYCKSTINDRYTKIWLWRREVSKPLGIHSQILVYVSLITDLQWVATIDIKSGCGRKLKSKTPF